MRADLRRIAARVPQQAVRIALLGNGAAWAWNTLEACFPEGRPALNYYQRGEHLHALAESHFEGAAEAAQWVEATLARLSQELVSEVIGGLRRMLPRSATNLDFLKKYRRFRHKRGWEQIGNAPQTVADRRADPLDQFRDERLPRKPHWASCVPLRVDCVQCGK